VRIGEFGKRLLHAAVLLFTSYWLIATSAPAEPARDCYSGLGSSAHIMVTLANASDGEPVSDGGAPALDSGVASTLPSCQGLDGIVAGAALLLELERGGRPGDNGGACYGYELAGLEGAHGISLSGESSLLGADALVSASGTYLAPDAPGCRGAWMFYLVPVTPPPAGTLISPLDAGTTERWRLVRRLILEQAHFCPGFTTQGELVCEDSFGIESIAEAP
jgi:hypothetical protein